MTGGEVADILIRDYSIVNSVESRWRRLHHPRDGEIRRRTSVSSSMSSDDNPQGRYVGSNSRHIREPDSEITPKRPSML